MDIRVYLSNGEVLDYTQTDSVTEQEFLSDLTESRLFMSRPLILGSGERCSMLQLASISRIDAVTGTPFSVHHPLDASIVPIEDDGEFHQLSAKAIAQYQGGISPGEEYQGYIRFDLAGNHRLQASIKRVLRDQLQFFTNLRRVFEIPVICFEHPLGGVIWLNVQNMLSVSTAPGFTHYPKGTLLAKEV